MAYCSKCGKEILDEAIACPFCGCATSNFTAVKEKEQPIIINNNNTAKSFSAASANAGGRRRHSVLFDILMICLTGGLWVIWMLLRPKY